MHATLWLSMHDVHVCESPCVCVYVCVCPPTCSWYGRMRGVYWGDSLATIGLAPPAQDPRMPDVVVDTQPGVIVSYRDM